MPIPFTCPHCGVQTNVDEQYAQQTGPCASCGNTITAPPLAKGSISFASPRKSSVWRTIVLILVVVLVSCVMLVAFGAWSLSLRELAREAARRSWCSNNLEYIGLAFHNYHDTYKCFPTAVTADDDGQPMRSWRVALLPCLDEGSLYDQYDFNEPWDGPNNRLLYGSAVAAYRCPSEASPTTTDTGYVMIVGKGTLGGEPNEAVRFADVLDGTSNTILAIEVGSSGIHWMEPRDLTVEEAVTLITNPAASAFEQPHPGGVNVLMADASVRFLLETTDPKTVRALLVRDDGQPIPDAF